MYFFCAMAFLRYIYKLYFQYTLDILMEDFDEQTVLFRRSHRDTDEAFRHIMAAHWPDEDSFFCHVITYLIGFLFQHAGVNQNKVAFGWKSAQTGHLVDFFKNIFAALDDILPLLFLILRIIQTC